MKVPTSLASVYTPPVMVKLQESLWSAVGTSPSTVVSLAVGSTRVPFLHLLRCGGLLSHGTTDHIYLHRE